MKGKIILLLTALVAIGMTIAIYNLAFTEWTSMIQLSLIVICVAELAIVGTLGLLPTLNFKNGSTGIMVNIYAGLMIIWSLIGCNLDGNTYPIGLLLISVIMLIFIGMSVMGSHESEELNKAVEHTILQKQDFTGSSAQMPSYLSSDDNGLVQTNLPTMWLIIQSTVEDYSTQKRLKVLTERIQALPANTFPNPVIENSMKQITAMCRALSNEETHDRILSRINDKAKELTNYIKNI